MKEKVHGITLIKSEETSPEFETILNSINTYLIRNKGAVSDFNLIKDIVDRNSDSLNDEIHSLMSLPLYLGLSGTMAGIIVGLFNMPSIGNNNFEFAIDMLIGGVKIAMFASLFGLLITIYLSLQFKKTKSDVEKKKNEFYSWIQTQLLPILSQNTTSSIYSLQSNLLKFNDTFESNISGFNEVLDKILFSFDSQVTLAQELKEVDVVQLAKLNVNVLKELRTSTIEFEKFNKYLSQMNMFVLNAIELNTKINTQIDRTNDFGEIAKTLQTNIEANNSIVKILDMRDIEFHKQIVRDTVIDLSHSINESLTSLKIQTQEQISAIKEVKINELNQFSDLISQDRGNLNELKKLVKVDNSLVKIDKSSEIQIQKLDEINSTLSKLNDFLKDQNSFEFKVPELIKYSAIVFVVSGAIISVGLIFWFLFNLL